MSSGELKRVSVPFSFIYTTCTESYDSRIVLCGVKRREMALETAASQARTVTSHFVFSVSRRVRRICSELRLKMVDLFFVHQMLKKSNLVMTVMGAAVASAL